MASVQGAYAGAIYAYNVGWQVADYSTTEMSRAGAYLNTDGSGIYHTAVIKFTIPAFSGVSQRIAFKMWANRLGAGYPSAINLRYAICKSDEGKASYLHTTVAITDSNQVAAGMVLLTDVSVAAGSATWQTVTIETDALTEGTWYLMLWGASPASANEILIMQGTAYHDSVTLTCEDAAEEPEDPEEPASIFCPISFRAGITAGLLSGGWRKEAG